MFLVKYLADRAALVYDIIRILLVSLQCHGCHLKPCGVQYIRRAAHCHGQFSLDVPLFWQTVGLTLCEAHVCKIC
jgi:hypothetical protein